MNSNKNSSLHNVVGLIPAAGHAKRLKPLPFSKELYPIGRMRLENGDHIRPKPVCIHLLESMKAAGAEEAFIIIRNGKWDIPGYLGDGSALHMKFAYLMMNLPLGVPFTINQAFPFVKNDIIVFGFPDIIFRPTNACKKLLEKQASNHADIVLGLFPTDSPEKWDMVEFNQKGDIKAVIPKPHSVRLRYTWALAVWTPVFTRFLNDVVIDKLPKYKENENPKKFEAQRELAVGDIVHLAIQNNLNVDSVVFDEGNCLDIGSPEDIFTAMMKTDLDNHLT